MANTNYPGFFRQLLLQILSNPNPTAARIMPTNFAGAPKTPAMSASAPGSASPPPTIPSMSAAAPGSAVPQGMTPVPGVWGGMRATPTPPPSVPSKSASAPGTASPSGVRYGVWGDRPINGGVPPPAMPDLHPTAGWGPRSIPHPVVTTVESFRLPDGVGATPPPSPTASAPSAAGGSPNPPAMGGSPNPPATGGTPDLGITRSQLASPMLDPTLLNISAGELQDLPQPEEEGPSLEDLGGTALQSGALMLPPSVAPSGAVAKARASQGSPDLISIIRKAINKL